ncbi:MAG: LuxR C-terminal-related transcriptional regulator [Acidobacteriota bacterium]
MTNHATARRPSPSAALRRPMRDPDLIRVVVADVQPIFKVGVRAMLARHTRIEVVGEADDTEGASRLVADVRPDVLLAGHCPPRMDVFAMLARLEGLRRATRLIVLTHVMAERDAYRALLEGAWGLVRKHEGPDVLAQCIEQVMRGEQWVGSEPTGAEGNYLAAGADQIDALTPRETEIVRRVATGANNRDIAAALGLGEQTVKNHLRRIFQKLGVASRVELALVAVERQALGEGRPGG